MNILVIGNGFDLEHNLKTTYNDFLNFSKWIEYKKSKKNNFLKDDDELEKMEAQYSENYIELENDTPKILEELESCILNNAWIKYFLNKKNQQKTWIDFESEIGCVIGLLEKAYIKYSNDNLDHEPSKCTSEYTKYLQLMNKEANKEKICQKDFEEEKNFLLCSLNRLIRALEIYFVYWIEKETVGYINPDLEKIHPDKIISFNYTHTFCRVYGRCLDEIEYSYIHGEAKEKSSEDYCQMVLGADDRLPDYLQNDNVFFAEFKKYYQRIYKRTDKSYISWLEKNDEPINLYIFGHSLDVTDKEVLEPFIVNEKVHTTIFYQNNNSRAKISKNLIRMIGKNNFIKREARKEIEFKQQNLHKKKIGDSNIIFEEDLNKIRSCKSLSEVCELIKKQNYNADRRSLSYFQSAKYVIRMYDVLYSLGVIDNEKDECFENLAKTAAIQEIKEKEEDFYDADEFEHFKNEIENEKTKELAEKINKYILDERCKRKSSNYYFIQRMEKKFKENDTKYIDIFKCIYEQIEKQDSIDDDLMDFLEYIMSTDINNALDAIQEYESIIDNNMKKKIYLKRLNKLCEKILEKEK